MIKIRNASPKAYTILKNAGVIEESMETTEVTYNIWLKADYNIVTTYGAVMIISQDITPKAMLSSRDFEEVTIR